MNTGASRGGGDAPQPTLHPAYHDHGNHDGCDADEVQLPREEVVNLLVAVFLWGTASGRSGALVLGVPRDAAARGRGRQSTGRLIPGRLLPDAESPQLGNPADSPSPWAMSTTQPPGRAPQLRPPHHPEWPRPWQCHSPRAPEQPTPNLGAAGAGWAEQQVTGRPAPSAPHLAPSPGC